MHSTLEIPSGVREGNEKLVRVSPSAAIKIFQLIEREKKGDFKNVVDSKWS